MSDALITVLIVNGVIYLAAIGKGIQWLIERRERIKATSARIGVGESTTEFQQSVLSLYAAENARLIAAAKVVEADMAELQRQLSACRSALAGPTGGTT